MKKHLIAVSLIVSLSGCAAPSVITGNSKSVVIDDGQYTVYTSGTASSEAAAKAEADKWCAKYNRVSGVEEPGGGRWHEFECVEK